MPVYHSASGSPAEDLFIDLFSETFGAEYNGPLVKTTNRKNIVNYGVLNGGDDFAAGGRA